MATISVLLTTTKGKREALVAGSFSQSRLQQMGNKAREEDAGKYGIVHVLDATSDNRPHMWIEPSKNVSESDLKACVRRILAPDKVNFSS